MGRDIKLTKPQIHDFEIIKGKYKNIIDIFDRTITKNAYFEFRPYTRGKYQFIFRSLDIKKTFIKISSKINNLFELSKT